MENSVSSAALNAAREQLDAAEAAREVILLQHIANGVIIDSRTVPVSYTHLTLPTICSV